MPTIRVPIEQVWSGQGSPGVNVWHIRTSSGGEQGQLDTMLGHLHTFYSSIAGLFALGWTASLGTCVVEETREPMTSTSFPALSGDGTDKAPPALAIVVGWRTSSVSRRGMGRTFLGPLKATVMDTEGTPALAWMTSLSTACQTLVDASLSVGNGAIAVYGYENAVPPGGARQPTDARVARDIVDFQIRDQFAVLRSRRD